MTKELLKNTLSTLFESRNSGERKLMEAIVLSAIHDLPTKSPPKYGYVGSADSAVRYFKDGAYHAQLCGIDPDYIYRLLKKNAIWREIFVDDHSTRC